MNKRRGGRKTLDEMAPTLTVEFAPLEPCDELDYVTDTVSIHVPSGHLLAVQLAHRIIESKTVSLLRGIEEYSGPAWWLLTESDGRRQEWQISNGLIFIVSVSTLKDWFYRSQLSLPFTAAEVCNEFLCERGAIDVKWWHAEDWGEENEEWVHKPDELRDRSG